MFTQRGEVCNLVNRASGQGRFSVASKETRKQTEFCQISGIMQLSSPGDHFNG